jgi:hypothetical protein
MGGHHWGDDAAEEGGQRQERIESSLMAATVSVADQMDQAFRMQKVGSLGDRPCSLFGSAVDCSEARARENRGLVMSNSERGSGEGLFLADAPKTNDLTSRIMSSIPVTRPSMATPYNSYPGSASAIASLIFMIFLSRDGRWCEQTALGTLETAIGNLVPTVPYLRAWQDMSLSELPSALGAVSRFAPRMPLLNPISTEQSLYLS